MSSAERVDRALAGLRALEAPQTDPGEAARRRRIVVGQLDAASLERSMRKKLLLSGGSWLGIAVAAAIALAVGLSWLGGSWTDAVGARMLETTGTVRVAGQTAQPAPSSTLAPNSEIATLADSSAKLETESGVRMALGSQSRLQVAGRSDSDGVERVELSSGSVEVRVPKLGPKRQFQVVTPDAVVIVHGTEFTVVVSNGTSDAPRTRVRVKNGRVEVRRKSEVVFLSSGKSWSSKAATTQEAEQPARKPAPDDTGIRDPSDDPTKAASPEQRGQRSGKAQPAAKPQSRLAQANALLVRAKAAAGRGDDRTALRHLNELLNRFGDSPVAASARVERFRALKRLGRNAEAASAADEYLEKEHDGLARDEARSLGK